jgi:hypothetical protein
MKSLAHHGLFCIIDFDEEGNGFILDASLFEELYFDVVGNFSVEFLEACDIVLSQEFQNVVNCGAAGSVNV